jgi:hypothetical protein
MIGLTLHYIAVLVAGSEDDDNRYAPPDDASDEEAYSSEYDMLKAVHMQEQPHPTRMK